MDRGNASREINKIKLINSKIILSAHDISEGGLFVTLAESGFNRNLGFNVAQQKTTIRKDYCSLLKTYIYYL